MPAPHEQGKRCNHPLGNSESLSVSCARPAGHGGAHRSVFERESPHEQGVEDECDCPRSPSGDHTDACLERRERMADRGPIAMTPHPEQGNEMIDKLTYVSCDVCGSYPTQPVTGGAREARAAARAEGYVRRKGMDLCPDCQCDDALVRQDGSR